MADDLDFFYSGGLNQKPLKPKKEKKGGFFEKRKLHLLPKLLSEKERHIVAILAFVILVSLIAIPFGFYVNITTAQPDFGGSFSEGLVGEPRFINPLLLQTDADRDLSQLVHSGLLKNDGLGNFVPDLAERFKVSEDGLTYIFNLRKNVKWHDGRRLISDDVIFTIRTVQNPDFSSPQRINWQGVEVIKIDDFTLEFKLKNPYAQFVNNLALGIIPQHLWQEVRPSNFILSELNLKPVGTGPYKFMKLKKDRSGRITSYELAAHKDYHLGRPFIESIEFKFYSSEEELVQAFNLSSIDGLGGISVDNLKSLRFPGKVKIEKVEIPRYFAVFFNQSQSDALSDKNVRLALAHSTNKDRILEIIKGNGIKADSPILNPIFEQFNQSIKKYDYNPEFAGQILKNSGWSDADADGILEKKDKKLEIELAVPARKELVDVSQELKAQWEAIGAKIEVVPISIFELQQDYIQPRNYQALFFGEVLNIEPDPFSFWHSSQKKDPGLNLALYDSKGADKLLEEARQAMNPVVRAAKYNDFQNLVIEDIPAIFLYSPFYIYPKAKKIKGFEDELLGLPSERFVNVHKWYIETQRVRK